MQYAFKRTFDISIAALLMVVAAPIAAVAALGILVMLGRPVLFRQRRPGFKGRPFTLYKFRTMRDAVDSNGRTLPDEQRMTRYGIWLRKLSIDEFPQLWNILRGEMSLVGPRPLLMEYLQLYSQEQRRRHDVLPGITGWAQVNGRNAVDWEQRFRLDVWYVDNRSFLLDLKILYFTIWRVAARDGIAEPGRATMTPFYGSRRAA